MRRVLRQVHGRLMVAGYKKGIIGHFEDIPLVSFHDEHDNFLNTVTAALALIREYDPRRFRRVVSQTHWIVDLSLYRGRSSAQFNVLLKAITIDFAYDPGMGDEQFHAAYFAGCFVHEATHGEIDDRGFAYSKENRAQIERICRAEQNRFLGKLYRARSELGEGLQRPFDPNEWASSWKFAPLNKLARVLRRTRAKRKEKALPRNP